MKKKQKLAFSLLEISIVVLLISIAIAAITESSILIRKFKLNGARSITQSSPVLSTPNLGLWLETASEASFKSTYVNNDPLLGSSGSSVWYDLNTQLAKQNNALSTSNSPYSSNPTYIESGINSLPSLNFDGSSQYLDFTTPSFMAGTAYTVFVVEQSTKVKDNSSRNPLITSSASCSSGTCFYMGYVFSSNSVRISHINNDLSTTSAQIPNFSYKANIPALHSAVFSLTGGRKYFYNGAAGNSDSLTSAITGNTTMSIGNDNSLHYYQGLIGEIIIFTRDLTKAERWAVEEYLSHKWGISVAQSS